MRTRITISFIAIAILAMALGAIIVPMSALAQNKGPVQIPSVETLRAAKGDWDTNPVAYVPEASFGSPSVATLRAAKGDWDTNPVAYVPEASFGSPSVATLRAAKGDWGNNPVAVVPESSIGIDIDVTLLAVDPE